MDCSLQDKEKDITIVNPFQKIIDSSTRKPNKIWIDKGREFYKNSSRKWLKDNDIEIHSAHDKGIFVVAERFIRNLNNKIYKHITAVSKIVYIDKIYDIINEYNNTHHRTIKMKPIETKDNIYIDTTQEVNDKDPKFKVGDHVRIWKYKDIFTKGCTLNWSEEGFVIKEAKNSVPWTYVINDLNGKEIIGTFYEKELQKTNLKRFRIERVIKRKESKLYVKWK